MAALRRIENGRDRDGPSWVRARVLLMLRTDVED